MGVLFVLLVYLCAAGCLRSSPLLEWLGIEWAASLLVQATLLAAGGWLILRAKGSFRALRPRDGARIKAKLCALAVGMLTMLTYSALMAELDWVPVGVFVQDFLFLLPLWSGLLVGFVCWADRRYPEAEDALFRFGLVLLRQRPWSWLEHKPLLLAWIVKILFLPLMYSSALSATTGLLMFQWSAAPGNLIAGLFVLGLAFDVLIAACGYLFVSVLFGNEIRSTDDNWEGWLVCLICYPPFVFILHLVKEQADALLWTDWLKAEEPLYWVWAGLIASAWSVYWLSAVTFGFRFSNLSWRGLVAHGPYRYTKHPGYIAKNIYWWAHTVPLYGVFGIDMLRNVLGLVFVSLVYYLRARTEERHLMRFPEYAAYAAWIEQNGVLARLGRGIERCLPFRRA